MKWDEADLRRAAADLGATSRGSRGDCPAPDRIWDALAGELGDEERAVFADHVALCDACAEEYRLARAARDEAPVVAFPARRSQRVKALAMAAGIVLCVGLAVGTRLGTPADAPARSRGGANATPAPLLLGDAGISIEPVVGATRYRLTIFDEASTPIWASGEVVSLHVYPPDDVRARIAAWSRTYVRVEALVGVEWVAAPLAPLRVAPRP